MPSFIPISMRHAIRQQNRKVQHSNRNGEGFLDHASNLIKDESQTRAEQERRKDLNKAKRTKSSNVNISSKARKKQQESMKVNATKKTTVVEETIEELDFPPGSIYDEDGQINPPQTPEERSSFNKNI